MKNTITNTEREMLHDYIAALSMNCPVDYDGEFYGVETEYIPNFSKGRDCEIEVELDGRRDECREADTNYTRTIINAGYQAQAHIYESRTGRHLFSKSFTGTLNINS